MCVSAAVLLLIATPSCGRERVEDLPRTTAHETSSASSARAPETFTATATRIVAFLRGHAQLDLQLLADSVTLYMSPEGGGSSARFTRDQLSDPSAWAVKARNHRYAFTPPITATKLTTRFGRHLNCLEYPLASRFPQLASLPHVGTKLESENATSCLSTWNVTFVFDSTRGPPRLVAAVYDQWEW